MNPEKPNPKVVGQRITRIRKKLGMTMEEFARKIDSTTSKGAVSNWEHGRNLPSVERLKKVAELGNYSLESLLSNDTLLTFSFEDEKVKNALNKNLSRFIKDDFLLQLDSKDAMALSYVINHLLNFSEKDFPNLADARLDLFMSLFGSSSELTVDEDKYELMYKALSTAKNYIDTYFQSDNMK